MFIPVSPVTYPEDKRILLNLSAILAIKAVDGSGSENRVEIEVAPGRSTRDGRIVARGGLDRFGGLPGMLATVLVRAHGDPVPAVVNLSAMQRIDPCEEGALLYVGSDSWERKFLVGASLDEIEARLRADP